MKCPIAFAKNPTLQAAFQRMYDTETALDDMDYATESPKLKIAIKAADDFRKLMEVSEYR